MSQSTPVLRALIVDDEPSIALTLSAILKHAGMETKAVFSGNEAVALARTFSPDLLIADYMMPDLDGMETAVQIKNLLPGCKVVLLSGVPLEVPFEPYKKQGYNFVLLSKPVPAETLLEQLDSISS